MTTETNDEEIKSPTISISLKTVGSVISGLVAILGSIWALDSHYASAADVERLQRSVESHVRQLRQERAEDELLKLSVKKQVQNGKLDPVDAALYDRYSRRINDTQKEEKEAVALEKAKK
jgi:hypothetical protein